MFGEEGDFDLLGGLFGRFPRGADDWALVVFNLPVTLLPLV